MNEADQQLITQHKLKANHRDEDPTCGPAIPGELGAISTSIFSSYTRHLFNSSRPYKIHYCASRELSSRIKSFDIERVHSAFIFRQVTVTDHKVGNVVEAQISHGPSTDESGVSTFILFEGGYPKGGEDHAEIHAPWGESLDRHLIPAGGSTYIEISWESLFAHFGPPTIEEVN